MRNQIKSFIFIFIIILISCDVSSESDYIIPEIRTVPVIERGNRTIGLDILNSTEEGTRNGNGFIDDIHLIKELGAELFSLHVPWTLFEQSEGVYNDPFISIFIDVCVEYDIKISFTIRPVDISGKTVPDDLTDKRFNNEEMIARFNSLITYLLTRTGNYHTDVQFYQVLESIQIGNEIDGYTPVISESGQNRTDLNYWSDYAIFLQESVNHIHSIDSSLTTGFTITYQGYHTENYNTFLKWSEITDVVCITYYPLDRNFDVLSPEHPLEELDLMVAAFPGKRIFLEEVGYQTSSRNNSSESKQALFFRNFFTAWDRHASVIEIVNINRLNDIPEKGYTVNNEYIGGANDMAAPYGIGSKNFTEYLRTLGLRTFEGDNKEALNILSQELEERGW